MNNWITILKYFTHGKQLPKEFIRKLEENFEYYWEEDRLGDITPENEYVQALPSSMKYLFGDVFHNYRQFFNTLKNKDSTFLEQISFGFQPRIFDKGEIIYEEDQEAPEMYFIISGQIGVGYSLPGSH